MNRSPADAFALVAFVLAAAETILLVDDGATLKPGDSGWSISAIVAYAAGRLFNYVGTPNWEGA